MEVVVTKTADEAAAMVADMVERLVMTSDAPVLGLATGSSPLAAYGKLVERFGAGRLTFSRARAFLLDEYVGLESGHPQAYRTFIEREFTTRVDFSPGALMGPDVSRPALDSSGARYEASIEEAGGIDLQILGIGSDGHIGFNEPTSSLGSRTRLKTLTAATRADNARFFGGDLDQVPRHVVTQGIGTILDAEHLVMVATGRQKAAPIALAVEGPIASIVPASALQLHPRATVVVDDEAASSMLLQDYYRETFIGKPDWQLS